MGQSQQSQQVTQGVQATDLYTLEGKTRGKNQALVLLNLSILLANMIEEPRATPLVRKMTGHAPGNTDSPIAGKNVFFYSLYELI